MALNTYIVRDVSPDAVCSYPRGRTLLNATGGVHSSHADGERYADLFNSHCHIAGVRYVAVRWDEDVPFPADQYEQP